MMKKERPCVAASFVSATADPGTPQTRLERKAPNSASSHALSHVVIVTGRYPGRGGVEMVVANLSNAFESANINVDIVTIFGGQTPSSATVIFDRRPGLQEGSVTGGGKIRLNALARFPLLLIKRFDRRLGLRRLKSIALEQSPDTLIIATSPRVATYLADAGILSMHRRPQVVVQYHIPFDAQVSLEGKGLPVSRALNVDAVVALSDADATRYQDELGTRCFRIPNPAPSISNSGVRRSTKLADKPRVVALCRLSAEKQLDQMIDIFVEASAPSALNHWQLDIYGEGPEQSRLEQKIAGLGDQGKRICLRGWVSPPAAALQGAAILISTSLFEAFGMSILDAAREGVASIAYACSDGVIDLVSSLHGILIPADDASAFAHALRELMANKGERKQRGAIAQAKVTRYNPSVVVDAWSELSRSVRTAAANARGVRADGNEP